MKKDYDISVIFKLFQKETIILENIRIIYNQF